MLIELQVALFLFAGFPETSNQDERLQYISWWGYLIVGIVYSIILFFDEIPKDRREIFSNRNKRSLAQILAIHASFVALVLCALRATSFLVRYLPLWMTYEIDLGEGYESIADMIAGIAFFIGAAALAACERLSIIHTTDGSESAQE